MALRRRGAGQSVRPGDMTHQLEIYTASQVSDGQGGRMPTWSKSATVWANINPIAASRAQSYGLTMNNKPHEIDLYWFDSYVPNEDDKMIVAETSQVLYVHSVINVDKEYYRCKILAIEKR